MLLNALLLLLDLDKDTLVIIQKSDEYICICTTSPTLFWKIKQLYGLAKAPTYVDNVFGLVSNPRSVSRVVERFASVVGFG